MRYEKLWNELKCKMLNQNKNVLNEMVKMEVEEMKEKYKEKGEKRIGFH